jgi:hypothetical protein
MDATGRWLNGRCPRLVERGHGSWYLRVELPRTAEGGRRQLRRGGFRSQRAARQARDYLRKPGAADPAPATVSTAQWLQRWLDTRLSRGSRRCGSTGSTCTAI